MNKKISKLFEKIQGNGLFLIFLLSVIVLAITKIDNSDVWTHLSIGREIFNLKGFPQTEPFTYPTFGEPFSYYSWLFGLVLYIAYFALNIYGVIMLKAVVITAAIYILTKDSLLPYKNYNIAVAVMAVVVILSRPRFIERPDIFLMLFLPFSIYSLNTFVYNNKRYLYLLPLVHMVWANMHVSIVIMLIPFVSFIIGGILQLYLSKKGFVFHNTPTIKQIKTILYIFIASIAASFISPYSIGFISQFTSISSILTSDVSGQAGKIIELQRPVWQIIKWPYIMAAALALSFIINFFPFNRSKSILKEKSYPSLVHLFLVIPFVFLSFSAMRFVFFIGIACGPILVRNLSEFFENENTIIRMVAGLLRTRLATILVAVWIVLSASLAIARIEPFGDQRKQFGFGINYDIVPEGALKYMDKRTIKGRIYNQSHWGQYITWRNFPERLPFVDGRYSIPDKLFEQINTAQMDSSVLDRLSEQYGYESILIGYPFVSPHDASQSGFYRPAFGLPLYQYWALVYWDDLSLLYLKRGGKYDSIIKEDEYLFINPAEDINNILQRIRLGDESYRGNIIRELKKNIAETGSSKGYAFLGSLYYEMGLYREAIDALTKVRNFQPISHLLHAYYEIGSAYEKLGEYESAIKYLKKVLAAQKDPALYFSIGNIYIKKGDKKTAISYFKKSLESNPSNPAAYGNLGYLYYDIGKLDLAYENHKNAIKIDPNFANSHFGLALVFKKKGDVELAKYHWKEYLRIQPTGSYAENAKKEIESLGMESVK